MPSLRSLIKGTPLEAPARFVHRTLGGKPRGGGSAAKTAGWKIRERRDEESVERILATSLNRSSNCIDIGAHQGVFLRRFVELAPEGNHIAIEPIPAMAEGLRRSFPHVDVLECALGATAGRTTFCYVPTMPAWSGLRRQPYPGNAQADQIEVEIRRLDDIVPADARVDFIKIDVEGAELGVLEGGRATIARTRPLILFEHARIHNTEYGTSPEMIHDVLGNCGLDVFCLDGRGPLERAEFSDLYHRSHASGYDQHAQTNFLARPA